MSNYLKRCVKLKIQNPTKQKNHTTKPAVLLSGLNVFHVEGCAEMISTGCEFLFHGTHGYLKTVLFQLLEADN